MASSLLTASLRAMPLTPARRPCLLLDARRYVVVALAFDGDRPSRRRVSSPPSFVATNSSRRFTALEEQSGHGLTNSVYVVIDRQDTAAAAERTRTALRTGLQEQMGWRVQGALEVPRTHTVFSGRPATAVGHGTGGTRVAPDQVCRRDSRGGNKQRTQRYRAGRSLRWVGSQEV